MSIGDNIKRIRTSHGLSQSELGKIAGVSDKAVSTWESVGPGFESPMVHQKSRDIALDSTHAAAFSFTLIQF